MNHTTFGWSNAAKFEDGVACGCKQGGGHFDVVGKMRPSTVGVMAAEWDVDLNMQEIVKEMCKDAGLDRVFHDAIQWV
jgi:hypothetical protein